MNNEQWYDAQRIDIMNCVSSQPTTTTTTTTDLTLLYLTLAYVHGYMFVLNHMLQDLVSYSSLNRQRKLCRSAIPLHCVAYYLRCGGLVALP